jgi:ionotropic glutamate receptor
MPSKFTPIRLVVGTWCLLTLVMLNVYNGVLISYVTETGRPQPLITSFYDVPHDSNILLVVDKGLAPDIVISVGVLCFKKQIVQLYF